MPHPLFTAHPQRPLVIAHRGGSLEAPENTVEALEHAVQVGSDWQEIDVCLAKDGHPVVIHDDTLERTTPFFGNVSDRTLAVLEAMGAANPKPAPDTLAAMTSVGLGQSLPFDPRFARAKVPSFSRALACPGVQLMVELKASGSPELLAQKVVEEVARQKAQTRVALGSFSVAALHAAQAQDPSIPLVGIAEHTHEFAALLALPLKVLAVHTSVVAAARAMAPAEVAIWTWTIYSAAQAQACIEDGADGLITDAPATLCAGLRARSR